nr:hypothetical protein [Leucobacter manosquensis]
MWHATPWDGQPGFWAAWRRFFYQFEGTAQLGDPNEPAYVPPANPKCPICRHPMSDHQFDRGGPGKPTYVKCPKGGSAVQSEPLEHPDESTNPQGSH